MIFIFMFPCQQLAYKLKTSCLGNWYFSEHKTVNVIIDITMLLSYYGKNVLLGIAVAVAGVIVEETVKYFTHII